jgi:DNA-binding XRE family transcriptional regulator
MGNAKYTAKPELKEIREKMCYQGEMADLINVQTGKTYSRAFYGNIEAGKRYASAEIAVVIARILKTDVSQLFLMKGADDGQS